MQGWVDSLRFPLLGAVVLASILAGCLTGAPVDYHFDARFERDELNFDGREHQRNCIQHAIAGVGTPPCHRVPTNWLFPAEGVRILDSFYVSYGAPGNPANLASLNYGTLLALVSAGSWHRSTGGAVPDVIYPGAGHYIAVLGFWDDVEFDDVIRFSVDERDRPRPDNEWVAQGPRALHGYAEPGSRPAATASIAPDERSPDFSYSFARYYYIAGTSSGSTLEGRPFASGGENLFLFLDGSLIQALTVTTVSDPVLAPTRGGTTPYTLQPDSLVDVDRYASVAPGSVEGLYQSVVWPILAPFASPNYGSCPNGCELGPSLVEELPDGSPEIGFYGRYPSELEPGSGSTRAGLHEIHKEDYAPWIDLLPRHNPKGIEFGGFLAAPYALDSPLPASSRGGLTMPPGHLLAEVWTGLWLDLDEDGWIGDADNDDPYERGARPIPHDYRRPFGEFIGAFASGAAPGGSHKTSVQIIATPLDPVVGWGPAGVYTSFFGTPYPLSPRGQHCVDVQQASVSAYVCAYQTHGSVHFNASDVESVPGQYYSLGGLFLPQGSPGFTLCTEVVQVAYHRDGIPYSEDLRDCDVIDPWP